MNKHIIDGIVVSFIDSEPHTMEEAKAYLAHAKKKYPRVCSLIVKRDGEYADLTYTTADVPFERIRRITGYLVGTLDRFNNAKRAEERDRVKHGLESNQEESQDQPVIRPGDHVLHKPTGEEWVVAGVNKKNLIPCGYPFPSMADLNDCELIKSNNRPQTEETKKALRAHGLASFIEKEEPTP